MFYKKKKLQVFFKYHFFFLFIFTGYLVSYFLFDNFTLFYLDRLDNEVVYNHVLGNFYKGDYESAKIFLNGETKIYWLRRLLQPYSLLYIFNTEFAYWFFDIFTKVVSYFSFYILAKKITKNYLISSLGACFFASLNVYSVWGLLISTFPYFTYLILFKNKIKFKHYIITILVALNSEIVHSPYFFIFLIIFLFALDLFKKENIKNLILISFVFYFFVLISNSNILYAVIFDGPFHREEIVSLGDSFDLKRNLLSLFYLGSILREKFFTYELAKEIPYIFYTTIFFPLAFFVKNKKLVKLVLTCFVLWFLATIIVSYDFYINKYWNPAYYFIYAIFIYSFIFLLVNNHFKRLIPISFIIIILFQVSSNFVPFAKKYVKPFKVENFRNYYTFEGYYLKNTYSKIKKIVKNEKVISLWPVDPMVAAMNNIKTLDGEHNLYPLKYKKKFYKIIKNELDANSKFKDYYLNWGHRVYAFVSDPDDVKIDFKEAKKQGAGYVISKYKVENKNLEKVLEIKDKETLFLYKII